MNHIKFNNMNLLSMSLSKPLRAITIYKYYSSSSISIRLSLDITLHFSTNLVRDKAVSTNYVFYADPFAPHNFLSFEQFYKFPSLIFLWWLPLLAYHSISFKGPFRIAISISGILKIMFLKIAFFKLILFKISKTLSKTC